MSRNSTLTVGIATIWLAGVLANFRAGQVLGQGAQWPSVLGFQGIRRLADRCGEPDRRLAQGDGCESHDDRRVQRRAPRASGLFRTLRSARSVEAGKDLPAGTPDLCAAIIVGFATIALSKSSVWLTATICQSSYPLKSENGRPLGTLTEYLSCAKSRARPPAISSQSRRQRGCFDSSPHLQSVRCAPDQTRCTRARMEFLARTGSHRDLLSCGSPQRAERRAQLAREDFRLFPRAKWPPFSASLK